MCLYDFLLLLVIDLELSVEGKQIRVDFAELESLERIFIETIVD